MAQIVMPYQRFMWNGHARLVTLEEAHPPIKPSRKRCWKWVWDAFGNARRYSYSQKRYMDQLSRNA